MTDISKKRGYEIDCAILSQEIGAPVVETVAIKKNGIQNLISIVNSKLVAIN